MIIFFFMGEKKMKKIIGFGVVVCLMIGILFFNTNKEVEIKKEVVVELGQEISMEGKDYIVSYGNYKQEELDQGVLELNKEITGVGNYILTFLYEEIESEILVQVVDTRAPTVLTVDSASFPIGTFVSEQSLEEYISVEDEQEIIFLLEEKEIWQVAGVYDIDVVVSDVSNNQVIVQWSVTIEEKEGEEKEEKETITQEIVEEKQENQDVENTSDQTEDKNIETNSSKQEDTKEVEQEEIKQEIVQGDTSGEWWQGFSTQEIQEEALASLVWYNEFTDEYYYGTKGLIFGFNKDNELFGGLKLKENPYSLQIGGYQFVGGLEMIARKEFSVYLQVSGEENFEIDCGTIVIEAPEPMTYEEILTYYGGGM